MQRIQPQVPPELPLARDTSQPPCPHIPWCQASEAESLLVLQERKVRGLEKVGSSAKVMQGMMWEWEGRCLRLTVGASARPCHGRF